MFGHLALGTPAVLRTFTEFHLDSLHFRGDGLEAVLVLLLAFQRFVECALLFADLKKKRDITKYSPAPYLLDYDISFLTALPL